ncbi:MAG: DUF3179 domain-containing protein [Actinomycetota bacterium]|nr:DUF3179 domain-containing protein [Actinomycetota bacterium]
MTLLFAGLLLLAGCTEATTDTTAEATTADGGSTETTSRPFDENEAPADADGADSGDAQPDPDFDYDTVGYDAEPAGEALTGDRSNPDFPPPLVPIRDITSGGPEPDGIPPPDAPEFVAVQQADEFMESDEEAIIVVEENGITHGYPIRIMTLHELVNDDFDGSAVTVSYCPLCNSALAYRRQLGGRVLDFGTSGELYQSAMVMYDRQTKTLWSHFLGRGLVGHYAGAQLELVPAQTVGWGSFKELYPDALVLSQDTGFDRDYGRNPYSGYDSIDGAPITGFLASEPDPRLVPMQRIVGVLDGDMATAATLDAVASEGVLHLPDEGGASGGAGVIFHHAGLSSALDDDQVANGVEVGQTGVFVARSEDDEALTFEAVGDGTFVDDQTGSTWTINGRATSTASGSPGRRTTPTRLSSNEDDRLIRRPARALGSPRTRWPATRR